MGIIFARLLNPVICFILSTLDHMIEENFRGGIIEAIRNPKLGGDFF